MKNHLVSDSNYNIVNLYCPIFFTGNDKIIWGLHLVLVTLQGWFTISFWWRQIELVTLNTTFSVMLSQWAQCIWGQGIIHIWHKGVGRRKRGEERKYFYLFLAQIENSIGKKKKPHSTTNLAKTTQTKWKSRRREKKVRHLMERRNFLDFVRSFFLKWCGILIGVFALINFEMFLMGSTIGSRSEILMEVFWGMKLNNVYPWSETQS